MKNLFQFFIFLCTISVPALAVCSDRPIIPTSSPKLITKTFAATPNFPTSTKQLSMTMIITPGATCPSGGSYPLIAIGAKPPAAASLEYLAVYIDCDSLNIFFASNWFSFVSVPFAFPTGSIGPVGLFLSIDLTQGLIFELQTNNYKRSDPLKPVTSTTASFDADSKFYLCSAVDGAGAKPCTVDEFTIEYRFYNEKTWTYAHLAGMNPALKALYPLVDGSLTSSIASASSAYFGDSASSPTAGTSPTWDSTNSFVNIAAGQFISFPLPSLSPSPAIPTVSWSFSFVAWVKITSLPSSTTTIFSMRSPSGAPVGYQLVASQSTKAVSLMFGITPLGSTDPAPTITLGAWQLIGFTAHITQNTLNTDTTVFVGNQWLQMYLRSTTMDLSTAATMRIGGPTNSFNGQVSVVRIMTPGGGVIRTTNLCSPSNSIELSTASFPLSCNGALTLNAISNTCTSTPCSSGNRKAAEFTSTPVCVPCVKSHCDTCDSTQCLTCQATYSLYQGECLSSCPDGTYSDGAVCQDCPILCTKCTSLVTCQECSPGYVLLHSFCIVPSSSSPSQSETETTAAQNIRSTLSGVGSVLSVGSSVMPITGLVSEVVQNTRYLNLSVSDELAKVYQTFSTDMISWDLPNFMDDLDEYKPLSELFARYELDSSFLVNFWSTMMTIGVSLCVLVVCLGIQGAFFDKGKPRNLVHSLVQKTLAGSINFLVVQLYGCLDNILFYFVLDVRANPLNTPFSRASFAFGIIFIFGGIVLMVFSIWIVHKSHVLKREGLAKNNMRNLETHQNKTKYFEVFYGDFNDAGPWSQCFLAFLVLRNNVSSLILTLLYAYPLMQTVFLIIIDGAIITFMIVEKPFTTLRGVFFQFYFEAIILAVHICAFLLSWNDEPSEGFKKRVCTAIIYLNTALVTGGVCFMAIDVHEAVRDKINEWKERKAEKKRKDSELAGPEEGGTSLQNDESSMAEITSSPDLRFQRNNYRTSSLQINPRQIFPKANYLPSPRMMQRKPRIEFINQRNDNLY